MFTTHSQNESYGFLPNSVNIFWILKKAMLVLTVLTCVYWRQVIVLPDYNYIKQLGWYLAHILVH